MVVTGRPATAETGAEHERNVCPSTWTVHAPHCAIPQPYLVPVRPSSSRMTHSSGVCGSPSNSRRVPLMSSVMDIAKLLVRSGFGASGAGLDPRGDQPPELRPGAGRRLAVAARLPSPAHQRDLRHVLLAGGERLAAVALRVLDLLADLTQRFGLPCHRLRCDMPERMAWNAEV